MTANEIRESFKKFFEQKQHAIVPSAPMVIKDDPTLMFTNAGMNQWKDIILGTRDPEPRRRADTQKCLRVSGKHNDLEEVGHDTYHHTMFEMLGNWSFGDYFKEGAIDMAWEYLVDVLKLNPEDLYVTVFEGDASEGLERDDEAAGYWLKHVPADHIINGNKHDNFWEMGDTGPCGPCSEIHVDSRTEEEKKNGPTGRELVNKDHPQVIEIWNLVFMQYNRKADGSLEKALHERHRHRYGLRASGAYDAGEALQLRHGCLPAYHQGGGADLRHEIWREGRDGCRHASMCRPPACRCFLHR